jgi:hypothetical protein
MPLTSLPAQATSCIVFVVQSVAFLLLLLGGIVMSFGGVIPPFGGWAVIRMRIRQTAAVVVVACAPIALPFILRDRVVLAIYIVFAVWVCLWILDALRRRIRARAAGETVRSKQ